MTTTEILTEARAKVASGWTQQEVLDVFDAAIREEEARQ